MSHFRLKGTSGNVINRVFPLPDTLVLGASKECDIRVDEPAVAPRQAEIQRLDERSLLLKDLGGNQETVLNGEPVQQQLLNTGDEIGIGTCRWILQAPGLRPARLLTDAAVQGVKPRWLRRLVWTLVAALAVAVAVLTLRPEWLAGIG